MWPRYLAAFAAVVTLSACVFESAPTHPAVRNGAESREDTDASRLEAVKAAAVKDLSCPQVELVLTFNRDYANVAQPSRVLDGCGKRAVYAEACSEYPRCTYLLLSILTLPSSAPAGSANPPP